MCLTKVGNWTSVYGSELQEMERPVPDTKHMTVIYKTLDST